MAYHTRNLVHRLHLELTQTQNTLRELSDTASVAQRLHLMKKICHLIDVLTGLVRPLSRLQTRQVDARVPTPLL